MNWRSTVFATDRAGQALFTILRLYGALEPWFDKTRLPGEIEFVK